MCQFTAVNWIIVMNSDLSYLVWLPQWLLSLYFNCKCWAEKHVLLIYSHWLISNLSWGLCIEEWYSCLEDYCSFFLGYGKHLDSTERYQWLVRTFAFQRQELQWLRNAFLSIPKAKRHNVKTCLAELRFFRGVCLRLARRPLIYS